MEIYSKVYKTKYNYSDKIKKKQIILRSFPNEI